jgi:hypothetical protein
MWRSAASETVFAEIVQASFCAAADFAMQTANAIASRMKTESLTSQFLLALS